VSVGGCHKEHRTALDERAVLVGERGTNDRFLEPIGKASRFTHVLELPHSIVVHRIVCHRSS
jgi:hypothetical protein